MNVAAQKVNGTPRRLPAPATRGPRQPTAAGVQARSDRVASGIAQKMGQTACKPGSVPPEGGDDHSSGPAIADRFSRPTRTPRAVNPAAETARRPYSVLLQAGLAMPSALPKTRWALTPPFHPYPPKKAVCFLWRCPSGRPGRKLSAAFSPWSPDFPRRGEPRRDRPAVWRGTDGPIRRRRQSRRIRARP